MGAVSATGDGELIMRYSLAQRILQRIALLGESAQMATANVLYGLEQRLADGNGAISLDKDGNVGIDFNSERMAWAYRKAGVVHSGINHGDDFIEAA